MKISGKMNRNNFLSLLFLLILLAGMVSCGSKHTVNQESQTSGIDLDQERMVIEQIDQQFSRDFKNKDSVALAAHYASDGSLGSVVGRDSLIAAFGSMIRYAQTSERPNLIFKTTSLSTDGEYLVEVGIFEFRSEQDEVKSQGKYLIVWKQENGAWKIYKDIEL